MVDELKGPCTGWTKIDIWCIWTYWSLNANWNFHLNPLSTPKMAPKFGFLVLLVSQMAAPPNKSVTHLASPPNRFVTQMVAPPNKSIKWCHHNIINLLKVVTPFGWLFYLVVPPFEWQIYLVVTPFGRPVVRENQTLEPFLEYKMDSNENFSCHSVISMSKCTKYHFLSDQCRVPLRVYKI